MKEISQIARDAKNASYQIGALGANARTELLEKMAENVKKSAQSIIKANNIDIQMGKKAGLSNALLDRLLLDEKRIDNIVASIREISNLRDPIGEVISAWKNRDGLWIHKVRVPIGVVCIIYESRPNVTADCIALSVRSGNACILKGGKEAVNSNLAIYNAMVDCFDEMGIDRNVAQYIDTSDRGHIAELLRQTDSIDLVIPRGGEGLIRFVVENSQVPVVKHYKGVCHIYVDGTADFDMAVKICHNAKVQRPGVCNAVEKVLVDSTIAEEFLPRLVKAFKDSGVLVKGCERARRFVDVEEATEDDWYAEYLDLVVAVKVVDNIADAVKWINDHGSHHSDAIITRDYANALRFTSEVDSAAVYVNASTRFTDGGVFGLGAEIGISTDKIHARGPMGIEGLTTYKYVVFGEGQIRQ